jgi:hypothetical protein
MNFNVETISVFDKQVKRLVKKFPSLKSEIETLAQKLSDNPTYGTDLGNGFFKIRISVRSKGKGKSGGARIITYVKIVKQIVYLTSIYDKSELSDIPEKELNNIFKLIP